MKFAMPALAATLTLSLIIPASAQQATARRATPSAGGSTPAQNAGSGAAPGTTNGQGSSPVKRVLEGGEATPDLPAANELKAPSIPLPTEPIGPFLLVKEAGPFMVNAHTFRGPDAAKYAQALAMELRKTENLPAYVFFLKILPNRSNIQGVPPTSPDYINQGRLTSPEGLRIYDEAAVLVGNCKSVEEAKKLMNRIKRLHPVCIDGVPTLFLMRKGQGLKRATITVNPYSAAQELYPGRPGPIVPKAGQAFDPSVAVASFDNTRKADPKIVKANAGPYNIFKCNGKYTMVVAEFGGRAEPETYSGQKKFGDEGFLKKSPLFSADYDAEEFAKKLAKHPALIAAHMTPYVYHDYHSSRVALGEFQSPEDPAVEQVRKMCLEWTDGKAGVRGIKVVLRYEYVNRNDPKRAIFQNLSPQANLLAVPKL